MFLKKILLIMSLFLGANLFAMNRVATNPEGQNRKQEGQIEVVIENNEGFWPILQDEMPIAAFEGAFRGGAIDVSYVLVPTAVSCLTSMSGYGMPNQKLIPLCAAFIDPILKKPVERNFRERCGCTGRLLQASRWGVNYAVSTLAVLALSVVGC